MTIEPTVNDRQPDDADSTPTGRHDAAVLALYRAVADGALPLPAGMYLGRTGLRVTLRDESDAHRWAAHVAAPWTGTATVGAIADLPVMVSWVTPRPCVICGRPVPDPSLATCGDGCPGPRRAGVPR